MKKNDVIRAWQDEEFRRGLSEQDLAALPAHPAGLMNVDDEVLGSVAGGCGTPSTFINSCLPPGCNCHCP